MVLVDVLFGGYEGQFGHLEARLITRSAVPVLLRLLATLDRPLQLPILVDALITDLLEAVHRLLLIPARTSHFIINCY